MKVLLGALLIVHGLIVAAQSSGSFGAAIPNEVSNPSFVSWYPFNMGRSWLFSSLGLGSSLPAYRISGLVWIVGGLILVTAGLSLFGILLPVMWWRTLAVTGAAVSLFALLLFFHPLMLIGMASSLAVLISIGWLHLPMLNALP